MLFMLLFLKGSSGLESFVHPHDQIILLRTQRYQNAVVPISRIESQTRFDD